MSRDIADGGGDPGRYWGWYIPGWQTRRGRAREGPQAALRALECAKFDYPIRRVEPEPVANQGVDVRVEAKLAELGLELPGPMWLPEGFQPLWRQVRVIGTRAVIAGHGPRQLDGTVPAGGGKIGADLTPEAGYQAARSAGLGVLGDLKREIGDLDRVIAWVRVFGLVNSAPGFIGQARVIDGFTELMVSLYGEDVAICPRAVAGAAELPFGSPVIIEGEVELAS